MKLKFSQRDVDSTAMNVDQKIILPQALLMISFDVKKKKRVYHRLEGDYTNHNIVYKRRENQEQMKEQRVI